MLSIAIVLFVLGLACGSFVNALVWRLHEQSKKKKGLSIVSGRSICPKCRHELAWSDLIPVVSWLILGGKCRYCKKPIASQYPIVELIAGIVFAGSYLLWPEGVHQNGQWLLLAGWLACSVGLLALAVYDIKWMLLPNRNIYPTLVVAVATKAAYTIFFDSQPLHSLFMWALSVAIASGTFYVLYTVSKGRWIGFGDVRLGLITGTLLAEPSKSLTMIFIASLLGTVAVLPDLIRGKKTMASKLPYGPFLIAATAVVILFGERMLSWYKDLIL